MRDDNEAPTPEQWRDLSDDSISEMRLWFFDRDANDAAGLVEDT